MKRKILYILTAVMLAAALFAAVLFAEEDDLSYSLNSSGSAYTVTGIGSWKEADVVIPREHEGLPVTAVATRAFEQNRKISSVVIPDTVTTIGDFAFSGCTSLDTVYLNPGLKTLGKGAFYNCTGLVGISLPASLSVIGDWAFWNCSLLGSVRIPSNVSSMGIGVFSGCGSLSDITIEQGISSLGQYIFADCVNLRTVSLPSSVASIGEYAFADCYRLKDIFFKNSNASINGKAFYGVSASAHYPCTDTSWSGFNFSGYGGSLTWISHTNIVHYPAVPATETAQGSIEYWYCSDCGKYFSDEACTHQISESDIATPVIGELRRGDVDGNGANNEDDVIRALYHLFFGDSYHVNQDLDFNGDGKENEDDLIRLLYNIFFGDQYPLS